MGLNFRRRLSKLNLLFLCLYFVFLIFYLPVFSFALETTALQENTIIRRMGLFISSENGGPNRAKLKYSFSDTQKLSQVITELGGLEQTDYQLLHNPDRKKLFASLIHFQQQITNAQYQTEQKKEVKTEFFLYYSGHSDEQGLLLDTERVTYTELKTFIYNIKSDTVVLILDSCASGAITRIKGGTLSLPFTIDQSQDTRGKAIITACSEDEIAQESDNLQASFFTYYLISGLRGAADINQDKKITLNEVYTFAYDETLKRTENTLGGPMHPSYHFSLYGRGDLLLTDINTTNNGIILKENLEGRVYIRDLYGKLLIEFNKLPGKEIAIAIPVGEYTIVLYQYNKALQCNIKIGKHSGVKDSSVDDFILIVENKEKINFKGPVEVLAPETETVFKTERAGYLSLAAGCGIPIPVDDEMKEYFAIGYMPLIACYFNFPFTWGVGSIELVSGTGINDMKDKIIHGCRLYSFQFGLGLQYKTNFMQPFYLFTNVTGGLAFNLFDYWENVDKQNDFRITPYLTPSMGFGIQLIDEINVSFFNNLSFVIFQDRWCVNFSPGMQLEYRIKYTEKIKHAVEADT